MNEQENATKLDALLNVKAFWKLFSKPTQTPYSVPGEYIRLVSHFPQLPAEDLGILQKCMQGDVFTGAEECTDLLIVKGYYGLDAQGNPVFQNPPKPYESNLPSVIVPQQP